jgi:hypothetical protein
MTSPLASILAGRYEAEPRVKSGRPAVFGHAAGQKLGCAFGPYEFRDHSYGLGSVPVALVAPVDEQFPEEPGPDDLWRLWLHVPAQHDEADGFTIDKNGPIPRFGLRILGRIFERTPDGPDELLLIGRDAQRKNRRTVLVGDFAERHVHVAQPTGARTGRGDPRDGHTQRQSRR